MKYPDGKKLRLHAAIGRELRGLREKSSLSLAALAKRSGIACSQLSKIEEGQACPVHVLVTLADVYDVSLDDMVPVLIEARAS